MFKKMCMNVVFLCCVVLLSVFSVVNCPPLAGVGGGFLPLAGAQGLAIDPDQGVEPLSVPAADQGGVDSYTKLMLHADGSDQGTSFTDSETTPKTVTNTESYDSYTKLMLHMEGIGNNFVDSAASKAVTANGEVTQTTAQYKFGSKSGAFDGTNDYLTIPDSDDWNFGSGDFTIDMWVRWNSVQTNVILLSQWVDSTHSWRFYKSGDWLMFEVFDGSGTPTVTVLKSWTITLGQWYHIAVVRYGTGLNNLNMYIDGVGGSLTWSNNLTAGYSMPDFSAPLYIGQNGNNTFFFDGHMDELRISKGIARWTSDFTPPSSAYGRVATITSQKKFGTASGEFHGSGDYLSLADSDDWNFGSGDFTIDFLVRFNNVTNEQWIVNHWDYDTPSKSWGIDFDPGSGGIVFYYSTNGTSSTWKIFSWSPSIGTWYHVAFARSGNNLYLFVDGTQIGSTQDVAGATFFNSAFTLTIGALWAGSYQYFLNGWIDEFRISKGIARWTSNFIPPTSAYETDTTPPTVSSTSPTSSDTGVGVSSAISATFSEDMDSSTITTSTFTLSSSSGSSVSGTVSYSNKVATFTPSSNLSYSTTYTATITTGVKDVAGNAMSSTYTWSFTTSSAPDTTAPTGSVSGASYTNLSTVTLTLSATDNVGVTGYYLSDSSTIPSASASGWTSVTSTTSYSGTVSYSLSGGEGSKTIYAWYKDAAGNVSSTANATITYDTTAPTVTISSPTSSSTYTSTSSTISLGGSASDSTSGISSVAWSNNRGGIGTATGTASWTVSSISLSSGDNVITVTAKDGAGNSGTDTLQVTYGTSSTVSAPTVSTGSASSVTTSSATLNGTVNANGASTTAWFQYGSTSGSYGNTSSTQTVTGSSNTTVSIGISGLSSSTKYYYRIAASNSGGTSYGSESSFTTSTASATPTPTPTPTATPTATTTPKPTPTAQPTPIPQVSPTATPAGGSGSVFGNVEDEEGNGLEGVTVTIERVLLAASQRNISVQAATLNQREG